MEVAPRKTVTLKKAGTLKKDYGDSGDSGDSGSNDSDSSNSSNASDRANFYDAEIRRRS